MPFFFMAIVALVFLAFGLVRPIYDCDLIAYSALAKEMRGAAGNAETYRELREAVGPANFELFFNRPYKERRYCDEAFFHTNLPFYRIRPAYILVCSLFGFSISNQIDGFTN